MYVSEARKGRLIMLDSNAVTELERVVKILKKKKGN